MSLKGSDSLCDFYYLDVVICHIMLLDKSELYEVSVYCKQLLDIFKRLEIRKKNGFSTWSERRSLFFYILGTFIIESRCGLTGEKLGMCYLKMDSYRSQGNFIPNILKICCLFLGHKMTFFALVKRKKTKKENSSVATQGLIGKREYQIFFWNCCLLLEFKIKFFHF